MARKTIFKVKNVKKLIFINENIFIIVNIDAMAPMALVMCASGTPT